MSGPTLIVSLGAFGKDVLERLRGAEIGGAGRPIWLTLPDDRPVAELVTTIVDEAEGLLGFDAAVQAEPGDERRPTLDVFIVGSFGEDDVPARLVDLVTLSAERLRSRFSNIFPGHDMPNLTVCPVVALIGLRRDGMGARAAEGLTELERRATSLKTGSASPVARVFVVEQQASRYELTESEVASTVVAFLSLVVGTDLRQQEPLCGFLRSAVDHQRDNRVFASFGCATLELSLHRYCAARGAGELVDAMRGAAAAGVAEHAVFAERLVPKPKDLTERILRPDGGEDLVAALRAHTPHIEFPSIGEDDTPEQIRDVAYGWGWFLALENAVKAMVSRLDEREMDEVTRVADERGLEGLRALNRDVKTAIDKAERSGPHGWASALRLAEHVGARAGRLVRALEGELKSEELPAFPEPTAVEAAFRAVREESTLRPRPPRMIFFGALTAIALGALCHHLPKWLVVMLSGKLSPLALEPSSMEARVGVFRFLLDPPYAFFWVTVVAGVIIGLTLVRHRVRRYRELQAARDALKAAVRRYLTDEVGPSIRRYYETRLVFASRAWAMRALSRVCELADAEVTRLGAISAALDRLSRELSAEARRSERAADGGDGDLVYRTHLSPELLRRTYEAARPEADLIDTLFTDLDDRDGAVPAYLFEENIKRVVGPLTLPSVETLVELAGPVVVDFVARRHARLGVPLEVRSMDERTAASRYLFAPKWAHPPLATLRETHPTLPEVQEHHDFDRVHIVTVQTALSRQSIVLPLTPKPAKENDA